MEHYLKGPGGEPPPAQIEYDEKTDAPPTAATAQPR